MRRVLSFAGSRSVPGLEPYLEAVTEIRESAPRGELTEGSRLNVLQREPFQLFGQLFENSWIRGVQVHRQDGTSGLIGLNVQAANAGSLQEIR
jgi:hypothetical protein